MRYILALDQGTTSSRAIVFDHDGAIKGVAQLEFEQVFSRPGWVEHDPDKIWTSQMGVALDALKKAGIQACEVAAIGISNQRETAIVWDRETGKPVYNAIVWQDRRTAGVCAQLQAEGHLEDVQRRTGLLIDSYFSCDQDYLDTRQCSRGAYARRGRKAGLWHGRQLAGVEAHCGASTCDRRQQCLADHAVQYP